MAALTQDRNTASKFRLYGQAYKVKADAVIFAGSMVAVDATGYLIPASDTAALIVVGIAEQAADATGLASGDITCRVAKEVAKLDSDAAGNAVTITDVGSSVDVIDDHTVATAGGTAVNSISAGTVVDIDDDGGIWVQVGF